MYFFEKKTNEVKTVDRLNKPHNGDKYAKFSKKDLVVEIRNVTKAFTSSTLVTPILKGIDLDIYEGEFVVILGPSGSGKTTLMNIISGLDRATSGYVNILGLNLINLDDDELTKFRRINIGYIFQQYGLIPNLTAKENIEIGNYLDEKNKKELNKYSQKQINFVNEKMQGILNVQNVPGTSVLEALHLNKQKLDKVAIELIVTNLLDSYSFIYCDVIDDHYYLYMDNFIWYINNFVYTIAKQDVDQYHVHYRDYLINYYEEWLDQINYRFVKEQDKLSKHSTNEIMQNLGIDKISMKYPNEMSGGQQQRVSIARSFAKNPSILFADEPTGAVDLQMSDVILRNFKEINEKYKTTIIIVTHNPDIAKLATKVIYFSDGKITKVVEQTPENI